MVPLDVEGLSCPPCEPESGADILSVVFPALVERGCLAPGELGPGEESGVGWPLPLLLEWMGELGVSGLGAGELRRVAAILASWVPLRGELGNAVPCVWAPLQSPAELSLRQLPLLVGEEPGESPLPSVLRCAASAILGPSGSSALFCFRLFFLFFLAREVCLGLPFLFDPLLITFSVF